jgi:hypothetical protein
VNWRKIELFPKWKQLLPMAKFEKYKTVQKEIQKEQSLQEIEADIKRLKK